MDIFFRKITKWHGAKLCWHNDPGSSPRSPPTFQLIRRDPSHSYYSAFFHSQTPAGPIPLPMPLDTACSVLPVIFSCSFSRVCSVTTIAARPIPEKSVKAKFHRQRHHISEVYVYGGEAESASEWCCCGRVILISRIARLGREERKNGVTKQHSAKQPHPAASLWPTSPARLPPS